jgi:riboflavin synthase
MFTGLIQAKGRVTDARRSGDGMELCVDAGALGSPLRVGDSVAISGCCCTVVERAGGIARFHLSKETLARTWLGRVVVGQNVNLETAVRAGDPLGGHVVQGHVDGVGEVLAGVDAQRGGDLRARLPHELAVYCVVKGSITLDGVSLTLARVEGDEVTIAVIPHTAVVTTLGECTPGQPLNVEVDILAKYVERLLEARFGPR